ncbi:nudix hydrolase 15, mitochondrial-like isoform X2 [Cajanus cajan]|uniref:nudix hydrolase 15, mitochondrial-like isoform X2 n=1 Tax=Cajanus cajan TaxID=3821 RepID=UPI0010FAF4B4|nr:nudix hydrolase 15, mitochondrial-like isoform X2 [Cajanus cajan]
MQKYYQQRDKRTQRRKDREMGSNGSHRLQALLQHFQYSHSMPNNSNSKLIVSMRAAVLICVFEGEVALPGGKREEGDADDVQTALREAKEEIGLNPSLVSVVTLLQPFQTNYGVTVIPVVGILSDRDAFSPVLASAEVKAIFDVPLEMFLKNDNRRAEEKEKMGEKYLIHYFDYENENKKYVIWGITASILTSAATLLLQQPPAFLEQRPKNLGRNHGK